jgi:hypothetical protein
VRTTAEPALTISNHITQGTVFDDEHSVGAVFRAQRNFNAGD